MFGTKNFKHQLSINMLTKFFKITTKYYFFACMIYCCIILRKHVYKLVRPQLPSEFGLACSWSVNHSSWVVPMHALIKNGQNDQSFDNGLVIVFWSIFKNMSVFFLLDYRKLNKVSFGSKHYFQKHFKWLKF